MPAHPPAQRPSPPLRSGGVSLRYRVGVLVRAVVGVGGGYGCAALAASCIAFLPGATRGDAVAIGMTVSFAVMAGVVIGVFAARSTRRACMGVALLGAVLFVLLGAMR